MALFGRWRGSPFVGIAVAGYERQALASGVQANSAEHPPDAVL